MIIQNGDIYQDQFGPRYQPLLDYWREPTDSYRALIEEAISQEGFKEEFSNGSEGELAERIAPDPLTLHWAQMTPLRKRIALDIILSLKQSLLWFPRYQSYLREHQPPTLVVWGGRGGYMPVGAGQGYPRDVPAAELHLLDGGHWLLETHVEEVVRFCRNFLSRVHA